MIEHAFCPKKDKVLGAKANPMKKGGRYRCTRYGAEFQIAKVALPPVKVEKTETESKSVNSVQGRFSNPIQRNRKSEGKHSRRNQKR